MSKNTIIVIDTDVAFTARFNKKLLEEELQEAYQIRSFSPDTTLSSDKLTDDCAHEVQKIVAEGLDVIGIFVDIVIIEVGGPLDVTGINIASKLREVYPNLPIFNITGKYVADDAEIISQATLEDVDGVLAKNYLIGDSFSAKRLKTIFRKASQKRQKYRGQVPSQVAAEIPEVLRNAYSTDSLDQRVKKQVDDIGAREFWTLLDRLLPNASGIVSYMAPGRSGAYVFRVTAKFNDEGKSPTRPKAWIVKVSNKPEILEKEIENYQEMLKTPLGREFYPKLFNTEPIRVESLTGIAIELQENADSLLVSFNELPDKALGKIATSISQVLESTYGDSLKKVSNLWNEFFALNNEATQAVLECMEQHETVFNLAGAADFSRVYDFLRTDGFTESGLIKFQTEVDSRTIHGDFNCRNLLVDNVGQLIIIDFFSRHQDHVAKDIAKLERDTVLRIFDRASLNEHSWERIPVWRNFSLLFDEAAVFFSENLIKTADPQLQKFHVFIQSLRASIKNVSPQIKEKEYLCALLHYYLLGIAHPEISLQKKAFAIECASKLLSIFE
jgi:hypothetical protein